MGYAAVIGFTDPHPHPNPPLEGEGEYQYVDEKVTKQHVS
jgi:hypothetical protein